MWPILVRAYSGWVAIRRPHDTPVRITTARSSRADDLAGRQRRYLWSMLLRTLCVVGAVVVPAGWARWLMIAGAVFLPYVAVVMANAVSQKDDSLAHPSTQLHHHQLDQRSPL